jgi:hypothetical protein
MAKSEAGKTFRPVARSATAAQGEYAMENPILSWSSSGTFCEVEAPPWWRDALEQVWPEGREKAHPVSHYGTGEGRRIEVHHVPEPGTGFIVVLIDPSGATPAWAQDAAACEDFLTRRDGAWLERPLGEKPRLGAAS